MYNNRCLVPATQVLLNQQSRVKTLGHNIHRPTFVNNFYIVAEALQKEIVLNTARQYMKRDKIINRDTIHH